MAPKTQEQFTVVCDGLFLNDTKPENWTQSFPWEPSVGFHFRGLDDTGEPIGDVEKKYLKKVWLFQAMGGKNAKGKCFRLEAEHGTIPAKNGQPEKSYTTITPLAEVFPDGTARFLEAPKDGKINVPATAGNGAIKPGPNKGGKNAPPTTARPSVPPAGMAAKVESREEKSTLPTMFKDLNTRKASAFFDDLGNEKSEAWWTFKGQTNIDGADATNVLDLAKQMTLLELSKFTGDQQEFRAAANESLNYWVGIMRPRLLAMKHANIFERLDHLLSLCVKTEQLDRVLYKGWLDLPESGFDALRNLALARHKAIQAKTKDGVFQGTVKGTLQPEIEGTPAAAPPPAAEPAAAAEEPEEAPAPVTKPPDEATITYTVRAINNTTKFEKLMDLWNTTRPDLQALPQVQEAMRLWVADKFMRAEYQADVDGIRKQLPAGIMTPELEKTLHARYAELKPF